MIGAQYHKLGAMHLAAYAIHAVWLEDHRCESSGRLADPLFSGGTR